MVVRRKRSAHFPTLVYIFSFSLGLNLITFKSTSAGTVLGDLAASMQPGTWAELTTNNINETISNTGGATGITIPYADGAEWFPGTRQLLFIGSDHFSTVPKQGARVRFVAYSENTNSWSILPDASWFPTPYPTPMHGYNHSAIDQVNGRLYHRPFNNMTVRKYDIASASWAALPAIPSSIMGYTNCCVGIAWFPERNSLIYVSIESGTNGSVIEYSETAGQWRRLIGNLPMGDYHHFAKYNPVLKAVLFGGGNSNAAGGDRKIYKLDSTGQVTALRDAPIPLGIHASVITVDPVSGKFLVLGNSKDFYIYDMLSDKWQSQSGSPPIFTGRSYSSPGTSAGIIATPVSTYGVTMFVKCYVDLCRTYLYKGTSGGIPPPPNITIPTVSIFAPTSGTTVSGTAVTVSANASAEVVGVQFKLDGRNLAAEDTSSPYSVTWNTAAVSNGTHTLTATARDAAGNQTISAGIIVTVLNTVAPPPRTPASGTVGGYPMPTMQDEKNTYISWGWTWTANKEPGAVTEPITNYTVTNPDIHGDTEGDDLWTYLMMYRRTGNSVYLNRANAWARYFKNDYRNCIGSQSANYCYDRDAFGLDHFYGWGLIALYEHNGDAAALAEAENLGGVLEMMYGPNSPFGCLPRGACIWYGPRAGARHLLFMTRLAQVTGNSRWITLRDMIINLWLTSAQWDPTYGTYFVGDYVTDEVGGAGAFASGLRVQSAFQIGILSEAFDYAYRATGNTELKNRIIAMARFVDRYGLDPTYQYTASWFGVKNSQPWHKYSATSPVTFWDPGYTTSLVNTLVRGYKYTGDVGLYNRAKYFFNRGTKGVYGSSTQRTTADNVVGHFIDTTFSTSNGNFYLDYNRGELQYTWLIFENGGFPTVNTGVTPPPVLAVPQPPSNLMLK